MATDDGNKKPADSFSELFGAYEALEELTHASLGDHPVWVLLLLLNREFSRSLDEAVARGWVS